MKHLMCDLVEFDTEMVLKVLVFGTQVPQYIILHTQFRDLYKYNGEYRRD